MTSRRRAWIILAVSLIFVAALAAGCQRERASNEKQARLLAAQNVELKDKIAAQEVQIKTLRQEHAEKIRAQGELLAQYKNQNEALRKDLREGIAARVEDVAAAVMNENARLRREIEQLRAEVEKLKDQVAVKARPLERP
jgi:DNA anti-recombination protein RmuC